MKGRNTRKFHIGKGAANRGPGPMPLSHEPVKVINKKKQKVKESEQ
jgi:hypothetical protein